jgi:hypothetical protein
VAITNSLPPPASHAYEVTGRTLTDENRSLNLNRNRSPGAWGEENERDYD